MVKSRTTAYSVYRDYYFGPRADIGVSVDMGYAMKIAIS